MQAASKTKNLVYIAVSVALMAICSWISIPVPPEIPFTLQTLAVFLAVGLLGGKRGTIAVAVYILMGAIGLPVFAQFTGGPSIILGMTGGYIVGFLFTALLMWAIEHFFGAKPVVLLISMVLGLIVCYAFGSVWFKAAYAQKVGGIGMAGVLAMCVTPYIIPDLCKIAVAMILTVRLRGHVG